MNLSFQMIIIFLRALSLSSHMIIIFLWALSFPNFWSLCLSMIPWHQVFCNHNVADVWSTSSTVHSFGWFFLHHHIPQQHYLHLAIIITIRIFTLWTVDWCNDVLGCLEARLKAAWGLCSMTWPDHHHHHHLHQKQQQQQLGNHHHYHLTHLLFPVTLGYPPRLPPPY